MTGHLGFDASLLYGLSGSMSNPHASSGNASNSLQPNNMPSGIPWVPPTPLQNYAAEYSAAEAAVYLASQQQQQQQQHQQQQQQQQQQLPQLQTNQGSGDSSPPAKKRGRPSGSNKSTSRDGGSDDKTSSIQEKNRQAQARFRERQKVCFVSTLSTCLLPRRHFFQLHSMVWMYRLT